MTEDLKKLFETVEIIQQNKNIIEREREKKRNERREMNDFKSNWNSVAGDSIRAY